MNTHELRSRAGFYGKPPTSTEICATIEGRRFLGYDDEAFGDDLRRFLAARFPEPCRYEAAG